MKTIIDNKIETLVPTTAVYSGYLFLLIGIIALFSQAFLGLGLIGIGILIGFSTSGVQIDLEKKLIKDYVKCFGIAFGRWGNIEGFQDISVLSTRQSSTTYSRSNRALTQIEIFYDVYFLNSTHRLKMKVKRCKEQDEAIKEAQILADQLGLNYTNFNPVISSKTRARRR